MPQFGHPCAFACASLEQIRTITTLTWSLVAFGTRIACPRFLCPEHIIRFGRIAKNRVFLSFRHARYRLKIKIIYIYLKHTSIQARLMDVIWNLSHIKLDTFSPDKSAYIAYRSIWRNINARDILKE